MKLQSKDGEHDFSVFMRVNQRFPEIFSVGLIYHPKDDPKKICLLRCNGCQGTKIVLNGKTPYGK